MNNEGDRTRVVLDKFFFTNTFAFQIDLYDFIDCDKPYLLGIGVKFRVFNDIMHARRFDGKVNTFNRPELEGHDGGRRPPLFQ